MYNTKCLSNRLRGWCHASGNFKNPPGFRIQAGEAPPQRRGKEKETQPMAEPSYPFPTLQSFVTRSRQKRRCVYLLWNHAKKQIYIGVSKEPVERWREYHAKEKVKATEHWNWDRDGIVPEILDWYPTQERASFVAHTLEEYWYIPMLLEGWEVIQTEGGI